MKETRRCAASRQIRSLPPPPYLRYGIDRASGRAESTPLVATYDHREAGAAWRFIVISSHNRPQHARRPAYAWVRRRPICVPESTAHMGGTRASGFRNRPPTRASASGKGTRYFRGPPTTTSGLPCQPRSHLKSGQTAPSLRFPSRFPLGSGRKSGLANKPQQTARTAHGRVG